MASDNESLLWKRQPRPVRGPKPGLSLEHIVTEAIALADEHGLQRLSMKQLAQRLGSGVMSLYRYVPGKDELVELMLDLAYGDPPRVPDDASWREGVTICAEAMRVFFRSHPWALPICTRARDIGPNETGWVESQIKAMSKLDAPPGVVFHLILIVSGYVRGAVAPEIDAEAGKELRFGFFDHPETYARYPLLSAALTTGAPEDDVEFDDFFEFGLARTLDGIAAYFDPPAAGA